MKRFTRNQALLIGFAVLAVGVLVLVVPPARAALDWVMEKVVAHGAYTIPMLVIGVLFVIALKLERRAWAALCALAGVVATGVYGMTRLEVRYPSNVLTDPASVGRVWRLVSGQDILLSEFEPRSTLTVRREPVERARFPAIDMHFHLGSLENLTAEQLLAAMDATGIERVVNLDGAPGAFNRFTREFRDRYPSRFIQFAQVDPVIGSDFPAAEVSWIRLAAGYGARGIKIHKWVGLHTRDADGRLVTLDDPRFDPIWEVAGELGLPVLIHTGDPSAFWQPIDRFNERYEELVQFPEWSNANGAMVWNREEQRLERKPLPSKADLLRQRNDVIARHPNTVFIGAHMGASSEDLAALGRDLDAYPNFYVDIASWVSELGRQPYTARQFFIDYQDRILFATDGGYALGTTDWNAERYFRAYLEFLQTSNEYIDYPLAGINRQGRWQVYSLDLPDEALRKILRDNAIRLLGLDEPSAP